jgi:putative tricarboxylic transport membrane protein
VFEAAAEALGLIIQVDRIAWMLLGCLVGLVVGLLPGLGGTVGMSILLPFIFGMDPYSGVALLIGMAAVIHTGDTFPAVLIGVPGSSGSQATIVDGYPLARQGKAAMALSAAFIVSMVGGVFGAVVLFATLSIAKPLVLALGSPELFMLAVFGLSMVGVLSLGSPLAGLISGLVGLAIGTIGGAPGVPVYRYTFDLIYLFDGIPLPVVALGLFAVPEMLDLLAQRGQIAQGAKLTGSRLDGIRAAFRHKWLVLRSAALGSALGIVPGIGGSVVDWIAYGITKQSARDRENFGRGDIRGVIGPESANNAKEGGALVPTLIFGIPGSGTTAMLLGGLVLLGIEPGPAMIKEHLSVTLSIVWSLALANIFGAAACIACAGLVARASIIPASRLVPFLIIIITLAAYQSTRHWGDIIALLVLGSVGWIMKQAAWPRAPLLIGFVLSLVTERYLHLSMSRYGAEWLTFPGVLIILAMILAALVLGLAPDLRRRARARRAEEGSS